MAQGDIVIEAEVDEDPDAQFLRSRTSRQKWSRPACSPADDSRPVAAH
jgi:hypothetical protein